jgi:hypothetical protein
MMMTMIMNTNRTNHDRTSGTTRMAVAKSTLALLGCAMFATTPPPPRTDRR